jgi:hypothetical protein
MQAIPLPRNMLIITHSNTAPQLTTSNTKQNIQEFYILMAVGINITVMQEG